MTDLPADGYIYDSGNVRTVSEMKQAFEDLRDFIYEDLGGGAIASFTISSGALTPTVANFRVDTEGAAASDDLDTISMSGFASGRLLIMRRAVTGRDVTVKHMAGGTGQIYLQDATDFVLDDDSKFLILYNYLNTTWREIGRFYGNAKSDFRDYLGLGTVATYDVGTGANNIVQRDGSGDYPTGDASAVSGLGMWGDYVLIEHQVSAGGYGGTLTSGTWNVRTLNTEVCDTSNLVTLSSNQITIGTAGTYYLKARAQAYQVELNKLRISETTGTLTSGNLSSGLCYGEPSYAENTTTGVSRYVELVCYFTLSAGDISSGYNIFELQHRCTLTRTISGMGYPYSLGGVVEKFARVEIWRLKNS